jgi:hypothetical protein
MSIAKNWCYTWNNYTDDDVLRLSGLVDAPESIVAYMIFGKEVGDSGTPHLQGAVCFTKKQRMAQVKAVLGGDPHLEVVRNINAKINYCKKEGDWYEFGELQTSQGKRSDIEAFKDDIKAGMLSLKEIREAHSEVYAKFPRFCLEFIQDHYPKVTVPDHPLRPWQHNLQTRLDGDADRRKIIFIVDIVGNSGKSWFAHWYAKEKGETVQVMLPGKKADMAYNLQLGLRVVFLDAPRSKQGEFIQYDFLEDLKNGFVFSPKYESRIKTYEPLHVVVNMNESPDDTKLSADRYDIINIRQL